MYVLLFIFLKCDILKTFSVFLFHYLHSVCDDEDIQKSNRHCWMGDRVGDYTQLEMTPRTDTQRYNPEVPFEPSSQPTKFNELVDKLLKIRKNIATAVSAGFNGIFHYSMHKRAKLSAE